MKLGLYFLLPMIIILSSSCTCIKKESQEKFDKFQEIYKIQSNIEKHYGYIKAQRILHLSFQTDGYITYNPYSTGDFVKKGTLLAKNDSALYKIKFQEERQKLQEAKIKADRQDKYYKRMDILHNSGAISDNDWEDAYYNLKTSKKEIQIQAESTRYYNKLIEYSKIIAPNNGYILERLMNKEEYAPIGKEVISMIVSENTQIETMVEYKLAQKLKINSTVTILKNNIKYKGKIKHISKSSENKGGYLIKIHLDKYYSELTQGENVEVIFNDIDKEKIIIPTKYILFENNEAFVYLINKEKIKIKTGQIKGENTEILEGLKIGNEIIEYQK